MSDFSVISTSTSNFLTRTSTWECFKPKLRAPRISTLNLVETSIDKINVYLSLECLLEHEHAESRSLSVVRPNGQVASHRFGCAQFRVVRDSQHVALSGCVDESDCSNLQACRILSNSRTPPRCQNYPLSNKNYLGKCFITLLRVCRVDLILI